MFMFVAFKLYIGFTSSCFSFLGVVWDFFKVGLGRIDIVFLRVYLGLRSNKARKKQTSRTVEKQRSKEAEQWRSKEATKQGKTKADTQNSGEAEK